MKETAKKNLILYILAGVFLATGIFLGLRRFQLEKGCKDAIAQAETAFNTLDKSQLTQLEEKLVALTEEVNALDAQAELETAAIADLEAEILRLEQEYADLVLEEDPAYYQAIYDSLTEGMSMVEEYINGK